MTSRTHSLARSLVLVAVCALAACKPATPPPAEASPDAAAASPPASTPSGSASATLAEAAARLNPLASPKDEIAASTRKFMAARSFHASMQFSGGPQGAITNEVDFVAPDRFRLKMPMGTQYIIGDTMYISADGRTMKVPMPKGTLSQWRDPAKLGGNEATMTVVSQGRDDLDGVSAHKYLVHNTQPQPSDVTIWIGNEGLPVQIQVSSTVQGQAANTTIRYSRFNDPSIRVEPPQ